MTEKKITYKNLASLAPVIKIIEDANEAINDSSKIELSNDVKEIVGAVAGGALGVGSGIGIIGAGAATGTAGAAALTSGLATAGGIVGGGMLAGVFVAAAPVAALGFVGYKFVSVRNQKQLDLEKEKILQEVIRKHDAIQTALKHKMNEQEGRLEMLEKLLNLLSFAQQGLESDLG